MKRPSILFINRVYPPQRGATGRLLQELARSFAKEGWHVTILTTGEDNKTERDGPIHVIRVKAKQNPRSAIDYGLILFKLYRRALGLPPRHLLVTMTDPPMLAVLGQRLAARKECKHIHWCQDLYPDLLPALDYKLPGFAMRTLESLSQAALKSCDKIITIGRCMAKHLSYQGIEPTKITVIPNWPNQVLAGVPQTAQAKSAKQNARTQQAQNFSRPYDKLIMDQPKFRVLYAGSIGRAHPIETILNAAQQLDEQAPQVEFVFIGDGRNFERLAKERAKRGLGNIRLIPYQPEDKLRDIMESGDLHLISMSEQAAGCLVPCKLYSALAVSRPCLFIGPEQCEAAKIIHDFEAGVVIHQGDHETLAGSISTYLQDSEAWFAAHNGAAKAGEIFLPEESINAWIERAWAVVHTEINQPPQRKKAA